MKPILKYTGGKRDEIKYFDKYKPKQFKRYCEPFVGGGAYYFYLEPENALINDLNGNLIGFYKELANDRDKLLQDLSKMKNEKEFYYKVRDMYNNKIPKEYTHGAIYAYMNRTAFSGMVRYNSKGEFNVPYGYYKSFSPDKFLTEEAAKLLQNTTILNMDFEEVFKLFTKDDFAFLDPPYFSTFTSYVAEGFDLEAQERLLKCFKETEAKCLMVISDLGPIREMYKDYIIDEYDKNYAINVKNRMKNVTEAKHLVIANYKV